MLKSGPLPKHYQLAEILRKQILSQKLKPNDQLPPEDKLCRDFGVSRGTVRQGISLLVQEGLVRREQGRGTFVNEPSPRNTFFTLASFNEDMQRQHRQPSTRMLTGEVIPAAAQVAERLGLLTSDPVIHVVRLRLADGQPVAHETRYLAQSLCPALLEENLETQSIHWLLVYKYQIPLTRAVHTIKSHILAPLEAELLQVEAGTPAFFVDRLTYTTSENGAEHPAVWYQAIYRGDEYHFKAEFKAA